jgi:PAS domain S-box-containing protein
MAADSGPRSNNALSADVVAAASANISSLAQAACVIAADETFLFVNEAYCRKTGRRPSEVMGHKLAAIIDPSAYDVVRPNFEKALRTRQLVRFSRPWIEPDGSRHWVEFHYTPLFLEDGVIWGFQAVAYDSHDITPEESDILERERLLRNLSDLTGNPMFYVDRNSYVRYANKPCLAWVGQTEDVMVGKHVNTIFSPDARAFYQPLVDRALAGETVHLEAPSTSRQKGVHRIKITVIPDLRTSGEISGVFISAQDVEDDYQLRQQLLARERQLRLFTDNVPEAIAYLDLNRRYKFVNKTFLKQRGLREDEVIGKTPADLLGHDVAAMAAPYAMRAMAGEAVSCVRFPILRRTAACKASMRWV